MSAKESFEWWADWNRVGTLTQLAVLHEAVEGVASERDEALAALREAWSIIGFYERQDRRGDATTRVRLWRRRHADILARAAGGLSSGQESK